MHRRVGRRGDLQPADEILFDQAILRGFQHFRIGQHRFAPGEKRGGLGRHILELIGNDVDGAGKAAEGGFIVVRGAGAGVHHIEGAGILLPANRRGSANPSGAAASASMRASCPPPRIPMVAPGFSKVQSFGRLATALVWRARQASSRLATFASDKAITAAASSAALVAPALPMASVPTGMPPGICRIESSEILALQRMRVHRHAEYRQRRHRCGHAGQMRGAPGAGDDHLEAGLARAARRTRRGASACGGRRRCGRRNRSRRASSVLAACFIVDQSDWLPMMIATGFDAILLPEVRIYSCGRKRRIIG